MPLYEYQCTRCGKTFEVMQKFSDSPLEVHEGCGGPVQRLISPPALQFKGTGWYVTDYAKNGSRKKAGKDESMPKTESTGTTRDAPAKPPEPAPAKSKDPA